METTETKTRLEKDIPQKDTIRWARAAWTAIAEPADATVGKLLEFFGPVEALSRVAQLATHDTEPDSETVRNMFKPFVLPSSLGKVLGWVLRYRTLELEQEFEWALKDGGSFLIPGDALWPKTLDTLGVDKPIALWVRGDAQALKSSEIEGAASLVGSRSATRYGMSMAGELAYDLAQKGIWVISGGAYGIDAAAHRGALGASGKTLSVQAGGLGELYPAMNASLFAQILETGAIISELPWSYRPQRYYFLSRNRLISALGQVVVVVEAGSRSGAMSTANHGAEQGRTVAAVPGLATSGASAGCHQLIREGATLVTCAEEIAELMQPFTTEAAAPVGAGRSNSTISTATDSLFSPYLKPETIKVFDALPKRLWARPEDIAQKCALGITATLRELGMLVLDGKAENKDGRYRKQAQ